MGRAKGPVPHIEEHLVALLWRSFRKGRDLLWGCPISRLDGALNQPIIGGCTGSSLKVLSTQNPVWGFEHLRLLKMLLPMDDH